jgi:putative PIN family toxin of toxin-antitoxin system
VRTVTYDTNVYISALNFSRGKPRQLLQLAMDGVVRVAISDAIMQEVLRVMREKFHATPEDLQEAQAIIARCTERGVPTEALDVVGDDPDDNRIVECAVASGSDCIVTGDNHLLRLGEYAGIKMTKVNDFLQQWQAE